MTQTLREKLELMIEALDAGETRVLSRNASYIITDLVTAMPLSRIPKPPETISGTFSDGSKWVINAPMREAPAYGIEYWFVNSAGQAKKSMWPYKYVDRNYFAEGNFWATEADAQAWATVGRRIRSGE